MRSRHADTYDMTAIPVECLRCGKRHQIMRASRSTIHEGECPRCGYVGWARRGELTETLRRALRERTTERRRLRPV